jgi:cyclase
VKRPELISEIAHRFGSQCVVVAIDTRWVGDTALVHVKGGSEATHLETVAWAREAADRGAGELLLTSMDGDGTQAGFDLRITHAVSQAVSIPVVASGGGGTVAHFVDVLTTGAADAALAASIFHFDTLPIPTLKAALHEAGIPVRL